MKPGRVLILALFGPAVLIHAQGNAPVSPLMRSDSSVPGVSEASRPALDNTYVIGPSDVVVVTVLKETALSGTILVRPDGMISMPLLGEVMASGLTPSQLADDIAARLKKYIQDPNVTVVLNQIHSKKVYLMGEVGKVGPVDITPSMTLLEAISSAGGLTQYANSRKIYILRTEGQTHQRIPVRYKQALKGDSTCNLALKPDDTIVVP
jgi:polysaccharide export outer membrane protein